MKLVNLRFLNGGYCLQFERLTGVRSWRIRKFQAVFLHFKHPRYGECLIDTGYGPENWRQWRRLPWCLLWPLTPSPTGQAVATATHLPAVGIDPKAIQLIFISHFHPDHIGGAKLFPHAQFVYREQSWRELTSLPTRHQLRQAFIPGLLPADFAARGQPLHERQFETRGEITDLFRSLDYFGDGSLIWLDLPGHAVGHSGFILRSHPAVPGAATDRVLYVTDACWDRRGLPTFSQAGSSLTPSLRLPWLTRLAIHAYADYQQTTHRLAQLACALNVEPLACHCPATQAYVTQPTH